MRFITGLLCVVAALANSVSNTPDSVYFEFSELLSSQASSHFPSINDYITSHKQYESRIRDPKNQLNGHAHPYYIELDDSCASDCHDALLKQFSQSKYKIYSIKHGVIYGSLDEIESFQSRNKQVIKHFAPMHPDMKIDAKIREMSSLSRGCYPTALNTKSTTAKDIKIEGKKNRVKVSIMPLQSKEEVEEFLSFVEDLKKQHKNQFTFEFESKQKIGKRMIGYFESSRCEKMVQLATAFAQRREVNWMEIDLPVFVHNRWSRGICDSGDASFTPLTTENIVGDGEVIAVSDTGLDLTSCYFYDCAYDGSSSCEYKGPYLYQERDAPTQLNPDHRKVIQYVAYRDNHDDEEAHGTHVCGSIAGKSNKNYGDFAKYNGMSFNASISFFDIGLPSGGGSVSPPGNLNDELFAVQYESGARIFSNSWGNGNNDYDTLSRDVDEFMWNHPEALILFSAGNTGYLGAHTAGSPSISKNGMCVGASLNNYDSWRANTEDPNANDKHDIFSVAYFSSQGPTGDNRMKPDVLAPGWYVQSAAGNTSVGGNYHCTIKGLSGTSMATPVTAGFALKVRQYYRTGYYPTGSAVEANRFMPSGALIKATLIHSAQSMDYIMRNTSDAIELTTYPSNIQGYGRIEMMKVLNFGNSSTNPISMFVVGSVNDSYPHYAEISSGSPTKTFTFKTSSSANGNYAIRITMCYTDYYPGGGGSGTSVNDLVLSASDTHGNTFTPHLASGMTRSTAQVIDIDTNTVVDNTVYTVKVTGSVSQTQPFALVITGDLTYLPLEAEKQYSAPSHSATYISAGAEMIIILIGIFVFLLCSTVYFFSRLTKRSRNLEYDPYAEAQNQSGIMGTVQRMRMAAIEKQRQGGNAAPAKKSAKKTSPRNSTGRASRAQKHAAPKQDYVYNPRDFE